MSLKCFHFMFAAVCFWPKMIHRGEDVQMIHRGEDVQPCVTLTGSCNISLHFNFKLLSYFESLTPSVLGCHTVTPSLLSVKHQLLLKRNDLLLYCIVGQCAIAFFLASKNSLQLHSGYWKMKKYKSDILISGTANHLLLFQFTDLIDIWPCGLSCLGHASSFYPVTSLILLAFMRTWKTFFLISVSSSDTQSLWINAIMNCQ